MTKYIFRYEKMKNEPFNMGYGRIPVVKNFDAYSDYAQMDDIEVMSAHIDWCEVVK